MLVLTWCVLAACFAMVAWSGVRAARNGPVTVAQLGGIGVVVVLIIAQMATAGIAMAGGHATDGWLLWGYLITAFALLPAAAWWALMDTSRWSSVVLTAAAFTVGLLQLRIWQIWVVG